MKRIVLTQHLYASQKHVDLVCGFYGYDHPKCKKAIQRDEKLYLSFMKQFSTQNKTCDDSSSDDDD